MRLSLIILSLVLVTFSSCKKIKKLTNFYIDYENQLLINPSQHPNNQYDVWSFIIQNHDGIIYGENHSSIESTETVELYSLNLSLLSPENGNLGFIDKIEIYIVGAGLDKKKIAGIDSNPNKELASINLDIEEDNLKDYMIDNQFVFHIHIVTNSSENIDNLIHFNSSFFISTYLEDV